MFKIIVRVAFTTIWICGLVALSGCSQGETSEVGAVITGHEFESGKWQGCMGTDWKTHLKTFDGHVDYMCGKFASVGDTIKGWWTEGHWDDSQNGFHRSN